MFRLLYQHPRNFFTILITVITITYWIFPDLMPYNHGFGFEGFTIYKPLAIDMRQHLLAERMNSYSIQRILPYILLHITFKVLSIEFNDYNMLLFFQITQFILGILIIFIWSKLCSALKINLPGQWVGYLSMLVNFATLKHDFYIPFTYDRLALTSGLLSLYFYFTNRKFPLFLNALVGLTIWPTILVFNLLMLLIPATIPVPHTSNTWLSRIWAISITFAICGLFVLVIYIKHIPEVQHLAPTVKPLLPLSIAIVAFYLTYTQLTLAQKLFPGWREIGPTLITLLQPQLSWLYAVVLILGYFLLTRVLGDPSHPYLTPQQFAINFTYGALQRPAQSLISHALYYGLPILVLALFWRHVLSAIRQLGLGIGLLLMVILVQAVNNETRQMANVLPLLALIAAFVADYVKPSALAIAFTACITLIISKCWLVFKYFDPYYGQANDIYPMLNFEKRAYLEWPQQIYFMNFGPWIATPYLITQSILIIAASGLLYWLWTHKNVTAENNQ